MEPTDSQVDLTNCDREPIHIPGSIQPHGCLFAFNDGESEVTYASDNVGAMLFQDQTKQILGEPIRALLGPENEHRIRNAISRGRSLRASGLIYGIELGEHSFNVSCHQKDSLNIVEFESVLDKQDPNSPLELTRAMISRMSGVTSVEGLASLCTQLLRTLLGYDRIMVYRFLENGSGQVIAEARRPDLESYRHQYFPASDIPRQARELYLLNPIRIISDARFSPVPLRASESRAGAPLDLSFAHLRSVSPIHCEYLQNMGVSASMSCSIIVDDKLWGLVACHHYEPKTLQMAERVAAEIFAKFLSQRVEAIQQLEMLEASTRARRELDDIVPKLLSTKGELFEVLSERLNEIRRLVDCDGVGLWLNERWSSTGIVPPTDAARELCKFLNEACQGELWSTANLSGVLPEAREYSGDTSGVIALPLSRTPQDYILFFRQEIIQTIEWGGNPHKAIETGPHGDRLTPRKSFDIWREEVFAHSRSWSEGDLAIAGAIRQALLEVVLRNYEAMADERRQADAHRRILIEELNHRVKNILALIRSLVSQGAEDGKSASDYAAELDGRIKALSFAHDQIARQGGEASLSDLIDAEFAPYVELRSSRIEVYGPPVLLSGRSFAAIALVLHELVTNAAKYGALSNGAGQISVTWIVNSSGDCELNWRETHNQNRSRTSSSSADLKEGFGTRLIRSSIPFDLGGDASLDFDAQGVSASFRIPSEFVAHSSLDGFASQNHPTRETVTEEVEVDRPLNILLVEDEFLIASDTEAAMKKNSRNSVVTVPSSKEAVRVLREHQFDCAILDVNLGNENSLEVAKQLRELGIPFVFATGYTDSLMIPDDFSDVPVARKPYDPTQLMQLLEERMRQIEGRIT